MESSSISFCEEVPSILKKNSSLVQAQLLFASKSGIKEPVPTCLPSSKRRKVCETLTYSMQKSKAECQSNSKRPLITQKMSNVSIVIEDDNEEVSSSCELNLSANKDHFNGKKFNHIDKFFTKTVKAVEVTTSCLNEVVDLTYDDGDVADDEEEADCSLDDVDASKENVNLDASLALAKNILETEAVSIDNKCDFQENTEVKKEIEIKLIQKPRLSDKHKIRRNDEKEKLKNEEKERKEKERQLLKEKREQEKMEREREKEEKKKQKEEEKRIKLEQLEEEKRRKEETRLEEKRRKDEEKRAEEEKIEKVCIKEKQLMQSFFIKTTREKLQSNVQNKDAGPTSIFRPFQLKKDMRLAPVSRYSCTDAFHKIQQLDNLLQSQKLKTLYLQDLKLNNYKPRRSIKTYPREDDLVIVASDVISLCPMKAKLLQFHDNYRPAYYGTWRKQSSKISGRAPLRRDEALMDYSVDSDEEWEEEEPGESISHSEGEDETQDEVVEDEGDGDDDFFVPHGYLSEGEGCADDDDHVSAEDLKTQQQLRARNWEAEMKMKKIEKLRPISVGIFWHDASSCSPTLDKLKDFKAIICELALPIGVEIMAEELKSNADANLTKSIDKAKNKHIMSLPEEAMPDLIRLVHGNQSSIVKIIREFRQFLLISTNQLIDPQANICCEPESITPTATSSSPATPKHLVSKRQLEARIREVASYEKKEALWRNKLWYVKTEVLAQYQLSHLPIPTSWKWLTKLDPQSPSDSSKRLSDLNVTPVLSITPNASNILSALKKQKNLFRQKVAPKISC